MNNDITSTIQYKQIFDVSLEQKKVVKKIS